MDRLPSLRPDDQLITGSDREAAEFDWNRMSANREPLLLQYWRIIKHHRALIIGLTLFFAGAAAGVLTMIPQVYTATTQVLIEATDPNVMNIEEVLPGSFRSEADYYRTQHEILGSQRICQDVIDTQGLRERGESFGFSPAERRAKSEARLLGAYRAALEVAPVRGTRLVDISFSSEDAELSAQVANAHAHAYIAHGLEMRRRASRDANTFLSDRLEELTSEVARAEVAANSYGRRHGIISVQNEPNVVVSRLAELSSQLVAAETERMAREAEYMLLDNRKASVLPSVVSSSLIAQLKEQLARAEAEVGQLASRFRPTYHGLKQAQAKVDQLRSRLAKEIWTIERSVESAFIAARNEESELRELVETQKTEVLRLKDAAVEHAMLNNEVTSLRQLYDNMLARKRETELAAELSSSNVYILEPAIVPTSPSNLPTGPVVALAGVVGLLLGTALAFMLEYLFDRIRNPEDLEYELGLAPLGVLPEYRARLLPAPVTLSLGPGREGEERIVPGSSNGSLDRDEALDVRTLEALREIRTNILLAKADEPPKIILFTSGEEAVGKSTTVCNLAMMFAQLDARVLVIDADLRRPSCHRIIGTKNRHGLSELLTGAALFNTDLHRVPEGFWFLSSGRIPPNPTELLSSSTMRDWLQGSRDHFDFVLIDSPPVLRTSDPVILSSLVDGVILVADQKKTTQRVLRRTHGRLQMAKARVLGVVVNRGDQRASSYSYSNPYWQASSQAKGSGEQGA